MGSRAIHSNNRVVVPMPCRRPLSVPCHSSPASSRVAIDHRCECPALPDGVTPAVVRDHLSTVLGSKPFATSRRMVRFLEFIVEELLRGRASELKEFVVGLNVFDRGPQYDPQCDPIVRVEARRLRTKLRIYYNTEGQQDYVRFALPKGGYAPSVDVSKPAASAVAPAPGRPSSEQSNVATVAVAPFQMLTALADTADFAEGLHAELIHALTRVPSLRLIASGLNSSNSSAANTGNLYSLCGSVRGAAQRLRITAHLVNTANGHFVWSDTYDRSTGEPFTVQEEVARAVAVALQTALQHRQA